MKTALVITTTALLGATRLAVALPLDIAAEHKAVFEAQQELFKAQEHTFQAHQRAFDAVKQIRETIPQILQFAQAAKNSPQVPEPPIDIEPFRDVVNNITWAANDKVAGIFGRPGPRKPLIVSPGEHDPKTVVALEEDLNVMARILEKTTNTRDDKKEAMGIALLSLGGPPTPRVMYLEGYGAVFMLNVKYPLLAPPKKDDQAKTNETTSSEWEQARAEVYGRADGGRFSRETKFGGPAEEFDAEQVERLKTQLIEDALVNATHIRNLKPNDFVTVVVLGGDSGKNMTLRREGRGVGDRAGYAAELEVRQLRSGERPSAGQTTMTLRVKKSDVDEFAKDKTKVDEFRKKVSIQVY